MSFTRFSVSQMMAVVGIVALNLATARLLASYDDKLMLGVMPAALVLQVALFRLVRTRGRRRAFWAGFLAVGLLAMLSFVWANRLSRSVGIAKDAVTGKTRLVVVPGRLGGDQMDAIWTGYVDLVVRCLPDLPQNRSVFAVVLLVPQMLAALLAGGLLMGVVGRSASTDGPDAPSDAPGGSLYSRLPKP